MNAPNISKQGSYETATIPRALKTFLFSSRLFLSAVQFSGKLNYKVLGLGSLREYGSISQRWCPSLEWCEDTHSCHNPEKPDILVLRLPQSKVLKLVRTKPNKCLSETAWRVSLEASVSTFIQKTICFTQVTWQTSI